MQNALERRVYTPQLSPASSAAVRRLAWAMNKPMTKAVEVLIRLIPEMVDPSKVCLACQDRTICKTCPFIQPLTAEEKAALLAF
ncbi:hypothetical protein AGMMS49579_08010 [Spirochaetia bacterium]|nr:hypothetical protein AGMMS49579_08010 [Spirochaetia bacterium]